MVELGQSKQFVVSSTLPLDDPGNASLQLYGAQAVSFECTAATSGTGIIEVQLRPGGSWIALPKAWQFSAGVYTARDPGTTITMVAGSVVYAMVPTCWSVRFRLTGTSYTLNASTSRDIEALVTYLNSAAGGTTQNILPVGREVDVTFTTDTSIYASGDVLADTQAIANFTRAADQGSYLTRFVLFDQDDNTAADMRVLFLKANVSLGSENSPPSISDANGLNIISNVLVASSAWYDMGGFKMAEVDLSKMPLWMTPASGTRDIYVGLITLGTPTQTASGLKGQFFGQDGTTGA